MTSWLLPTTILWLGLFVAAHATAQPMQYACEPLESTSEYGDEPVAINNRGAIAGYAELWKRRKPIPLAAFSAHDINDHGTVVGANGSLPAVRWSDGTVQDLQPLPGDGPSGMAWGLNHRTDVVGHVRLADGDHAVLWRGAGAPIELPPLPGFRYGTAFAISGDGTVVGHSAPSGQAFATRAVRWHRKTLAPVELGMLPGFDTSSASAINRSGVIVGNNIKLAEDQGRAVAWLNDGVGELVQVSGDVMYSQAMGINTSGAIVGYTMDSDGGMNALLWPSVNEPPIDLNTVITGPGCKALQNSHARLWVAVDINDEGVIAAGYYSDTNRGSAVRLVPVASMP